VDGRSRGRLAVPFGTRLPQDGRSADNHAHATSRTAHLQRLQHVTSKEPFETVVAVHGATVLRVCRAVLGAVDADDAWSETFLSALKAYPDLPGDANVEAWLVTIAHRKAIDVTRGAVRRAVPTAELPEAASGTWADSRDLDLDLVEALARLPAKQRQAVAYHYLAGLPYREVAAILGGSADAARRAAADGIATLRRTYPGLTSTKEEAR
jgi:RNA polymerase sigma factor (sigma-70 family)